MTVAADDRTDCLERHVATLVAQGWRVESQGRFQAVVSKQQPRNLAVNLFLTHDRGRSARQRHRPAGRTMIRVRFEGVVQHDTIMEPRTLGDRTATGRTVDDAWWVLAEQLAEQFNCDPRDFTYDDWQAADAANTNDGGQTQ